MSIGQGDDDQEDRHQQAGQPNSVTVLPSGVSLPVSPAASADDLLTVAATAGARPVVIPTRHTEVLAGLQIDLAVPVDGPQGTWATGVSLGSRRPAVSAG